MELNFAKNGGYVLGLAQDWRTGQLLMAGHINPLALQTALRTGLATWWSMSRNELWTKGLTSGDTLKIIEVKADCDRDAILYLVEPQGTGGACHKAGWYSCFEYDLEGLHPPHQRRWSAVLQEEEAMIRGRLNADPVTSHTAKSLAEPMARVAQKIGEEGLEVALALTAPDQGRETIISETADLLYRLQIGLVKAGINWSDVEAEIVRRRG